MKLAYWKCRGLAHPIILMLEYCEAEYEFQTHECGPAPYFHKEEWHKRKYEFLSAFDFPNLPYLEDGDVHLTHHVAIIQYLGRKFGLSPITDGEHCNVDLVREQIVELEGHLINAMYFFDHRRKGIEPTFDEIVQRKCSMGPPIKINISDIARKYQKQVQSDPKAIWMAGRRLTYVDFLLYEQVDYARNLYPDLLDSDEFCPSLKGFMDHFEELPTVKGYLGSQKFNKFPFYGERSYLGRSKETCYQDIKCCYERKDFY